MVVTSASPDSPAHSTSRSVPGNSRRTWRQAPQGVTGSGPLPATAMARKLRDLAATAATTADRSAQMARP